MDDKSLYFAFPCSENMDQLFDEASKQTDDCPHCGFGTINILYVLRQKPKISVIYRSVGNITDFDMCIVQY